MDMHSTERPAHDQFVISTIAMACNYDTTQIDLETSLWDVGMDSMSLTTVIALIEAQYEHEFTPEEISKLVEAKLVADFVDLVRTMTSSAELV